MGLPEIKYLQGFDYFEKLINNIYSIKLKHKSNNIYYKFLEYAYISAGKQTRIILRILDVKTNQESYINFDSIEEITENDLKEYL